MNILAIDTTGSVASVSIVCEEKTIGEYSMDLQKNHSQTILPMLSQLLSLTGFKLEQVDYIACSIGPGSFTGLRIGAACAKGLAFGIDKKIVPVPTLDALAYNVYSTDKIIAPLMDARRGQVYAGFYQWQNQTLQTIMNPFADDLQAIFQRIRSYNRPVVFTGDGATVYQKDIQATEWSLAPPHLNRQRAAAVGALALDLVKQGRLTTHHALTPIYLRKPQAEREYELKHGNN